MRCNRRTYRRTCNSVPSERRASRRLSVPSQHGREQGGGGIDLGHSGDTIQAGREARGSRFFYPVLPKRVVVGSSPINRSSLFLGLSPFRCPSQRWWVLEG